MHKQEMKAFQPYVRKLQCLVESLIRDQSTTKKNCCVTAALNGQPADQLRSAVPLADRRAAGIFFTGAKLARHLSRRLISEIPPSAIIADIGCGAGDLILACALKLPLALGLNETLQIWGKHLMAFDIHPEFISATKTRLVLLAISRGVRIDQSPIAPISELFPMIREHDFLSCPSEVAEATHIVINPPYYDLTAPSKCMWGNRKISAAALFIDACVSNASPGAKIAAILPDVLRSGSYYEKWRQHIESLSQQTEITIYGQFDKCVDVDVFILKLLRNHSKQPAKTRWWNSIREAHKGKVGDHFKIHVGPVVPHRDPEEGPLVAYIHAKPLAPWGRIKRINERRRYKGTLFRPPFVAVRRTSRPGDKRAIGTIITGKRPVAVENHLIALFPNKKTISECKELLRVLKSPQTNRWLDKRIRCRHLTVEALKEMPCWRV